MKTILLASAALLIATSAYAGKAEDSATFRVKVVTCKASAKTDGVKTNSAEFYSYMGGCLDRVTVAVNLAPAK
jgi:hypothetical protein